MSRSLYRLGRYAAQRPLRVIGVWILLAILVIAASSGFGRKLEDSFSAPGLDSSEALELLTAAQSKATGPTAVVVLTPVDEGASFLSTPSALEALLAVEKKVATLPNVVGVAGPAESLSAALAESLAASSSSTSAAGSGGGSVAAPTDGSVSADGRVALIRLQYAPVEQLSATDLENLKGFAADERVGSPLRIELNGELFFTFEQPATNVGELIGIFAAVVILLLAFGSVIAMGLPIGLAVFGLALGITSMPLIAYLTEIPSWAPQIASMVGLGVGIDYALLIVSRHREFLARGMSVAESVARANATAGQAVIFAGGTVVIAILGLAVAGVPFMTSAGIAISFTVLLMVLGSISLLPAFLGLAGHRINRWSIGRSGSRGRTASSGASAGWERWGNHVSKHAWQYVIGVTVLLLALTAPVFSLRLGFPDDGTLPESRTERRAYDLVAQGFGAGINGPLLVAVDVSKDRLPVEALRSAIAKDRGVASVSPAMVDPSGRVATLMVTPKTSPQDDQTFVTVQRLRAEVFPKVLDGTEVRAHIGGQTASLGDIGDRVNSRLPWFIAAVVLLSVLLLMFVFRSVLVPLKAAVMNLLSIGSAYGVMVMVFQWGWGKGLIGLESTVPVVVFIPMFMFAILFGLSMDYEVFLLSRVREEYLATGDSDQSVIHGIAGTARVITSAALIMISVFLGFVLGDDPATKMMGLGLATAIFVDATIVRMILVPATMKLMGNANWWLPGWLDRLLPTIDMEGEGGLPAPEMDVTPRSVGRTVGVSVAERG